jgi:surfeit locus 1 family protein
VQGFQDSSRSKSARMAQRALRKQSVIFRMFSRRWLLATVLVVIGVAVNIRLGIWQLDRLEQRRAFNSRVLAQIDQPVLDLTNESLDQDLAGMEYRQVIVTGVYDLEHEVALRNQVSGSRPGVHLLTPLKISDSDQSVLVNRGWVPIENGDFESWASYPESGTVTVHGVIRASQDKPDYGRRSDPVPAIGEEPLKAWYFANVEGISQQVPYPLLPVYVQQAPDPTWGELPYRSQPELDLSEGPHQSYAIQWFTFAVILGLGYPFFIRRQERKRLSESSKQTNSQSTIKG